jgi:hypothetical protein
MKIQAEAKLKKLKSVIIKLRNITVLIGSGTFD